MCKHLPSWPHTGLFISCYLAAQTQTLCLLHHVRLHKDGVFVCVPPDRFCFPSELCEGRGHGGGRDSSGVGEQWTPFVGQDLWGLSLSQQNQEKMKQPSEATLVSAVSRMSDQNRV